MIEAIPLVLSGIILCNYKNVNSGVEKFIHVFSALFLVMIFFSLHPALAQLIAETKMQIIVFALTAIVGLSVTLSVKNKFDVVFYSVISLASTLLFLWRDRSSYDLIDEIMFGVIYMPVCWALITIFTVNLGTALLC
jgi:hypothetical protein